MGKTDVLVIGGGIVGTSATYFLSKQGVDVTLIERSEIGREASGATAGSMGLQSQELELLSLAREGLAIWAELQGECGRDLEFRRTGGLRVAENKAELEVLRRDVREQRKLGLDVEILSANELKTLAPYLGSSIAAASYCEEDSRGNPLLASVGIALAAQSHGARIRINEAVRGIKVEGNNRFLVQTTKGIYRSTCILNSAGVWSKEIFRMIGLDIPITLDPMEVMVTEQAPSIFPHMIMNAKRNLTAKQMESGNVVIGGGWKASGDYKKNIKNIIYESMSGNIQVACRTIPALSHLNIIRCWAGLEGRSPDRLPLLGSPPSFPGFFSACCVRGGFTMGPALGKLASELIVKGKTSFPSKAFDVNRVTNHS